MAHSTIYSQHVRRRGRVRHVGRGHTALAMPTVRRAIRMAEGPARKVVRVRTLRLPGRARRRDLVRLRGPARRLRIAGGVIVASTLPWLTTQDASARDATSAAVTTIGGVITPVVADHLRHAVDTAGREGHELLLVELDTPGGLDTSMREIVKAFLASKVPVVVYVAPAGARAASAGAVITLAANVAAMAPGTSIGSATPVQLEGGGDAERKAVEDAAAYVRSLADLRDRNAGFAVDMVKEGRSAPAAEAARIGAVDLIAGDRSELLERLDGMRVQLGSGRSVTLETDDVSLTELQMGPMRQLLQWLAHPNIAFLLLSIGTLAIIYELAGSGLGFGGILGVILVILALFGLSVLPIDVAGLVLLALAAGFFIAELFVPGVGVFAAGGSGALILAGLLLFRGPLGVDPIVLLPTGVVVGVLVVLAGRLVWRSRKIRATTGEGSVVGHNGVVREAEGGAGLVSIDGAWWSARSPNGDLREGQVVVVQALEGLDVIVWPVEQPEKG